ncbi:MAG: hypothetical protein HC768_20000 [Acaryochloris sp. CRU_2_0]|nr:hypothetical protein [Acaryochloris sp. CRU_2_0]
MRTSSARTIATVSLLAIAIASYIGLDALPDKDDIKQFTLHDWVLVFTSTLSFTAGMNLLLYDQEDCPPEDEKPNPLEGSAKDDQESSPSDLPVHTHNLLPTSFDEDLANILKDVEEIAQRVGAIDEALAKQALAKANAEAASLAEREQQTRANLIAMLSDLGLDGGVLTPLFRATRICMDARLWREPAKYQTRYQDTERFYVEEMIWPIIRDNQIEWGMRPDFEVVNEPEPAPPSSDEDLEPSLKQASFRPYRCCYRCKYIGGNNNFCAVVPFGCTGDPSEQCREFERKDSSELKFEFTCDDIPF